MTDATAIQTDTTPHLIRITTHGKIKSWVEFALDFLDNNEERPLTLHTLPPTANHASTSTTTTTTTTAAEQTADPRRDGQPGKPSSSQAMIPRLITVVEIIKREYLNRLRANKSPRLLGVHQYNEIGCLEDLDPQRAQDPIAALMGSKNLKIRRTVFMKITLSKIKLQHLVEKGATYQPPKSRELSKSARQRARKRLRRQTQAIPEGSSHPPQEVVEISAS